MGRYIVYVVAVLVFTTISSWVHMFHSFGPSSGSGSSWSSNSSGGGGSYGGGYGGGGGGGHK
jgi:hypothetical protein